jgi:DNA-binding MarR family transcriptional regulator
MDKPKEMWASSRLLINCDLSELTFKDQLVLLYVARYADEKLECFPSQQKIADQIGSDRHSVNKSIKKLVRLGYLEMLPKVGRNNQYRLTMKGEVKDGKYNAGYKKKKKKEVEMPDLDGKSERHIKIMTEEW